MRFKGLFGLSAKKAPAVLAAAAVLGFAGAALADGGAEHRLEQLSLPIVLGTSGGNINNFGQNASGIWCCGGTLGALVTNGTNYYILSNNHVLARVNQTPTPSFTLTSSSGIPIIHYFVQENIIQPGLIDQGQDSGEGNCAQDDSETVANLTKFVQIHFDDEDSTNNSPVNNVDAAIALVVEPNDVSEEILDIGQVSTTTVPMSEALNMRVKKSGRTTGLTNGKVRAINVTSNVGYTDECGDGVVRTAYFENQILVWGGGFSAGGDSGSLVVERVDVAPRPVGLLFAGSQVATIINPIDTVLDELSDELGSSLTIVGASGGTIPPPPEEEDGGGPPPGRGGGRFLSGDGPFGLEVASAVKERHEDRLFDIPGVVGTGISVDDDGNPVIEIYVERATRAAGRPIPQALEGVPVRVVETGRFIAY